MPPQGKMKTNFKTYEASTRLLAAVIATTGVKLDYEKLAEHVGGGATKDAINHRLRPIKQLAKMQAACVKNKEDPGDLPVDKGALAGLVGGGAAESSLEHRMRPIKQLGKLQILYRDNQRDPGELPVETREIQKLFGESTPQGLEWQFRDIKNLGKAQQEAVKNGENPAHVLVAGTPSAGRARGAGARTPGSGATAKTPGTGVTTSKRGHKRLAPVDSSEENDSSGADIDTPSKRTVKKTKAPAATISIKKENKTVTTPTATPVKTITGASAEPAVPTTVTSKPAVQRSIFGGDSGARTVMQFTEEFDDGIHTSFTHGTQNSISATKPVVRAPANDFTSGANPFTHPGIFDDDYAFEDGEA